MTSYYRDYNSNYYYFFAYLYYIFILNCSTVNKIHFTSSKQQSKLNVLSTKEKQK